MLFNRGENNPKTLSEVIGQGSGAISMCWSDISDAGVFQSELASSIVDEMVGWIEEHYIPLRTFCGPTEDEDTCACGCSGPWEERCPLYLHHSHGNTQVPDSHICCKVPGR